MIQFLCHLINDYSLQKILIGTSLIGITSGLIGVFTFLRKQSLLGDAISHAALPGVVLMFLLTQSQHPVLLFLGGFIAGIIGIGFIWVITRKTKLKKDAALGIVLSVFFGFGLVLLTIVQKNPVVGQTLLHRFLFGDASTLLEQDIYFIACMATFVCLIIILLWKEFKLISFDQQYGQVLGFSTIKIELILTVLLVTVIVVGLQMVGVILMSALLISSAVTAGQWTNCMERMAFLSALCGGISCVIGSAASFAVDNVPTGPAIVLVASSLVLVSFIGSKIKLLLQRKQFS